MKLYRLARAALAALAFIALQYRLIPALGPAVAAVAAGATTIAILWVTRHPGAQP